jgi:hypothetical protein
MIATDPKPSQKNSSPPFTAQPRHREATLLLDQSGKKQPNYMAESLTIFTAA